MILPGVLPQSWILIVTGWFVRVRSAAEGCEWGAGIPSNFVLSDICAAAHRDCFSFRLKDVQAKHAHMTLLLPPVSALP